MDDQVEQWLSDELPPDLLLSRLSEKDAQTAVDLLKQEADRHWSIDPNISLKFAERIVAIGKKQNNSSHIALGLMARGDALSFLGRTTEAWEALDESGRMFQSSGDEVGWARTRIGRLHLSVTLNCVTEAISDAERARAIFSSFGEHERLLRLENNIAYVQNLLGDQLQALRLYHSALAIAETLGDTGQQYLGLLYMNIGLAHESLGDFSQALAYYEQARAQYVARQETLNIAVIELNIAYIAQARGHYRHALSLLYGILERGIEQFPVEYRAVKRDMIECYLYLNRYGEARDLASQIISDYRTLGARHDIARNLLHLATAEAELKNFNAAQAALEEAEPIFNSLGASAWTATTRLKRGRVALKQGDFRTAYEAALIATDSFQTNEQQVNYAAAVLLQGQAQLAMGDFQKASKSATIATTIAQHFNVPSLRYAAHLLQGQILDAQGEMLRAVRRYQAAIATVERVQRGLTITLRTGFLEDKGEASRNLIDLYLRANKSECAFDALERAKSQVLLSYIANREQFHWSQHDAYSQTLMDELNKLRGEHQWFYGLAHESSRNTDHRSHIQPDQALAEVATRERRIRLITEQLYLHANGGQARQIESTSLKDVQSSLPEDTLLIEFYNDGARIWAFIINRQHIHVQALPITVEVLNQLLSQLRVNISGVLAVESRTDAARRQLQLAQRILKKLYTLLIEPLPLSEYDPQKLVIVPYGALHYLPFNSLHNGSEYLIEKYEIAILPTAGLATRPKLKRDPGALILANSWGGRLPHTLAEAQMVQRLFNGTLCSGEAANRDALQAAPTQILHIAAHGQHRLDQPELSYLQLADGQLYADDTLQQDMSYELVTLSACETGRANVSASDELIGLGRGFLYAGAGALLLSMWQVPDISTLYFMERFYRALNMGDSKGAALRQTQRFMLQEEAWAHPAFWGAFQLIGDDRPLSIP